MDKELIENIHYNSESKSLRSYKGILKGLVEEMSEALVLEPVLDFRLLSSFNYANKNKLNPFGYDLRKGEKHGKKSFDRSKCLLHKLIRIHKEFRFVKSHMQNYRLLTPREKEIVQLLAKGNNNPEIAKRLFLSRHTVEQHHKHINHKLEIKSLPHLLQYAYAFNLI